MPFTGLILSGGKSSRMGTDKSQISFHGKPQREYLHELLRNFCLNVYLSCKMGSEVPATLNPVYDQFPIDSPLNGILSGMSLHADASLLTVPVDMPQINKSSVSYLVSHRDPKCFATCFYDSDGQNPDPLFCIWEKHSFSRLLDFYSAGGISPRKFLMQHPVKLLVPMPGLNLNINTPEDLDRFRADLTEDHSSSS